MSKRLYVGRLPPSAATGELEDAFRKFGDVRDCFVKGNYGFVVCPSVRPSIRPQEAGGEADREGPRWSWWRWRWTR